MEGSRNLIQNTINEDPLPIDGTAKSCQRSQVESIQPIGFCELVRNHPSARPAVIEGVLRQGETCNIIASAKVGKSFMAGGLAWCIATGRPWLSHPVTRGKVCIIDNELHPETLAGRLDGIANAMMVPPEDRENAIDVLSLRGVGIDIHGLESRIAIVSETYSLLILDALYRFLPKGTSENDNAQIMAIYNRLDEYAKRWKCAIAVIHHASKGQQGDKAITDVGAGAGSIGRAADTHIVIRPHAKDGISVVDFACRSFEKPKAVSIQFDYPLWRVVEVQAEVRESGNHAAAKRAKQNEEADNIIRHWISNRTLSVSELRGKTGMGHDRIVRSLRRLNATSRKVKSKKTGKTSERYSLQEKEKSGGGCLDGCSNHRPNNASAITLV